MPRRSSACEALPVRRAEAVAQAEARVERVAPHHHDRRQQLAPHDDRGGDAAALGAERRQGERAEGRRQGEAEHQQGVDRHLQRQAAELQHHHRLRPRDGDVEAAVGHEHQRGGQGAGEAAQVAAHLLGDRRLGPRQGEERLGQEQHRAAEDRQRERQPDRLLGLVAALAMPAGAEQLAGDRPDRQDHAHQADEDRDVDRAADRQRRQVERRGAGGHDRVDGAERQHRDLADEHRPGERKEAERAFLETRPRHEAARAAGSGAAPRPRRPAGFSLRPRGRARRSG